jgi:hypothetical protein
VSAIENHGSQIRTINSSESADQHSIAHVNAAYADELAAVARPNVIVDAIRLEVGQPARRASVKWEAPKVGYAGAVFNICQRLSVG